MLTEKQRLDIHNSDVPVVCQSCEARHKGICGALSPEQLAFLGKHTTRTSFDRERELAANDTDIETYSNILSGVVKLTKLMADGRQQIVGLQFAPDFLGRPFAEQNVVSAEAATQVRLCSFPKWVIEEIIERSPRMERKLYQQTLRELDEAREWMLTLGRKTACEKVASFLLLVASHVDPEAQTQSGMVTIELPLKRADIADFLGLTVETVSRQLTHLRKRGVVEVVSSRSITVGSLYRLQAAAESGSDK